MTERFAQHQKKSGSAFLQTQSYDWETHVDTCVVYLRM